MIKKIVNALTGRKEVESLDVMTDQAFKMAIHHLLSERCVCMLSHLLDAPDGDLKKVVVQFVEWITPFEVDAEKNTVNVEKIVRNTDVATHNLQAFDRIYDCSFTAWVKDKGVVFPEVLLPSNMDA